MTVLRAFLDRRSAQNPESPAVPLTEASLVGVLGGEPTEAGVAVTPETAMRMTAVYRSIAILAGLMGALPMHAYRKRSGSRQPVDSAIIDTPHPDKTPFEVWEHVGQSLLGHGNAYLLKLRDGLGRVRELEPLHPGAVRVERNKGWRSDTNPSGKRFFYREGGGEKRYVPYELLHVPGLSYDGVVGLSPIAVARQEIGTAMAASRFGARLFGRGALIDGVLTAEHRLKDENAAKRLKDQFRERVAGPDRQWDIPILDSGVKFERIGLPPEDAQFIETRRFGVQEIARLYGLPPHLLADVERSTSWGTGIEQQNMQMLTFTADPWLVRVEQRVTREVILDSRTYVKFNRAALLRPDTAARYMAYQRAISFGWMNADEIRSLEDLDPLPDGLGRTFYRPGNAEPVGAGTEEDDRNDG